MPQRAVIRIATHAKPEVCRRVIAVGASAGGIQIVREFLHNLPVIPDGCLLIVIHLAPGQKSFLPKVFRWRGQWETKEAQDGETIRPGVAYIAPPNLHLVLSGDHLRLLSTALVRMSRPSVDVLFHSVAEARGEAAIGVLLSGAGRDGSDGIRALKKMGGCTIVQDPAEALFSSMPLHGIETGCADFVMKMRLIAPKISSLCS